MAIINGQTDVTYDASVEPLQLSTFSSWSWYNQGSATLTQGDHGVVLYCPANASTNYRGLTLAVPSTPYQIIARVQMTSKVGNYKGFAVGFADSNGGKMDLFQFDQRDNRSTRYMNLSSPTAVASEGAIDINMYADQIWLKYVNDGSNLKMYHSSDGDGYVLVRTTAIAAGYLTTAGTGYNFYALGANSENGASQDLYVNILEFETGAP